MEKKTLNVTDPCASVKQTEEVAFCHTSSDDLAPVISVRASALRDPVAPYVPAPIDLDDVELTPDILELSELLAKNTHEVWSENRIKDGWSYGEERNDTNKKHPCLIPYEALSESEKDYDRSTSIQTLKLIIKLGYHIVQIK